MSLFEAAQGLTESEKETLWKYIQHLEQSLNLEPGAAEATALTLGLKQLVKLIQGGSASNTYASFS